MGKKTTYAAPTYGEELELVVGEDVEGERTALVPSRSMKTLGLKEGDYITLFGAWTADVRAYGSKDEANVIHLDSKTRRRLPVERGVEITIRKKVWEGIR